MDTRTWIDADGMVGVGGWTMEEWMKQSGGDRPDLDPNTGYDFPPLPTDDE